MKSWKLTELQFIRQNLHQTDKELAAYFKVSQTAIHGTRLRHHIYREGDGRFQKGQTSWNTGKKQSEFMSAESIANTVATRFKKGNIPHNAHRKVGDVFVIPDRTGKKYKFIKLEHHRQYSFGRYVYEQATGEKVQKNEIIKYIDGNTENCDLTNLQKITRAENLKLNQNREKMSESLKKTWAVVRAFNDYGIDCPYKLKPKKVS